MRISGSDLNFSSYLGGTGADYGHRIRLDSANYIYVTGWTGSDNFPTENSYQSSHATGTYDAFVSRLNFSATTPTPPPPTPSPTLTPEGYKTPTPPSPEIMMATLPGRSASSGIRPVSGPSAA